MLLKVSSTPAFMGNALRMPAMMATVHLTGPPSLGPCLYPLRMPWSPVTRRRPRQLCLPSARDRGSMAHLLQNTCREGAGKGGKGHKPKTKQKNKAQKKHQKQQCISTNSHMSCHLSRACNAHRGRALSSPLSSSSSRVWEGKEEPPRAHSPPLASVVLRFVPCAAVQREDFKLSSLVRR